MLRRAFFVTCMVALPLTASAAETSPTETRSPANDVVFEATAGYGAGFYSAVQGADPRVTPGLMFHGALGWAWGLDPKHSIGILAFGEGQLDGDKTTSSGTKPASRIGAAGAFWTDHVHLRAGFGWAHATLNQESIGGLGVSLAAGLHLTLAEAGKKRGVLMIDVLPSWDFFGVGSETLHRLSFGLQLGVAVL